MESSGSRRIHIVSAGYLRRFGQRGLVVRHDVATGSDAEKGVTSVGWQLDYWGPDQQLADEVERSLPVCEDAVLRMLRRLDSRWPLASSDRAQLAQSISIHIVRTGAFRVFLRGVTEEAIDDARRQERLAPREFRAAAQIFRGYRMHANALLGQISRIAGLLCSMQWSLVRFDKDLLVAGDQPVVILPLQRIAITPASAMPSAGFVDTLEIRFPLDPRTLLLMCWAEPADPPVPFQGTYAQTCNANCSQRAQALGEWFFRPRTTPPFLAPPLMQPSVHPLSTELWSDYSAEAASSSGRRRAADALVAQIVEAQEPRDRVRWVVPRPAA